MTAEEFAKEVGLTAKTVRQYARRGILPGLNFGGKRGWVLDREKCLRALSLQFGNAAEKDFLFRKH